MGKAHFARVRFLSRTIQGCFSVPVEWNEMCQKYLYFCVVLRVLRKVQVPDQFVGL
jgi:hypothetical protein